MIWELLAPLGKWAPFTEKIECVVVEIEIATETFAVTKRQNQQYYGRVKYFSTNYHDGILKRFQRFAVPKNWNVNNF